MFFGYVLEIVNKTENLTFKKGVGEVQFSFSVFRIWLWIKVLKQMEADSGDGYKDRGCQQQVLYGQRQGYQLS